MKKPLVAFVRPVQWVTNSVEQRMRFHFLPLLGINPVLRDGKLAHDSVGGVIQKDTIDHVVNFFRKHRPDFFLFGPMYVDDGTKLRVLGVVAILERLKGVSPSTRFLYWNGNQQGKVDFNVEAFLPFLDAVLTNTDDPTEHRHFKIAGIQKVFAFYQFGFAPEEHGREPPFGPFRACHFAGSQTHGTASKYPNSEWRYRLVLEAKHRFDLAVYGKGRWPFPHDGYFIGQDFYDTFPRSRVILGANHWDYVRYYTRRTVYALASGRPYVVRYIPGMEKDFEQGRHLVWFSEIEEGVEIIRQLLDDPEAAKRIGREGRERAEQLFSWQALQRRFEELATKELD